MSNVPHFGFVCCVFWWLEWGCGFGGEHRSGEAALSSHAFRGSLASVGQHGAHWPGHPVPAVPARCLLSPSCLLWRPLSEAVALRGVGTSRAPRGVGVAGEIHGIIWNAVGGFPVPHVWISPSFPCVGWGSGKSVGHSGHEPALRGFAAHSVAAVAVGSAFIVRVGGTLSLAGAPRCSPCACLSPRVSQFPGSPGFFHGGGVEKPGSGHWCPCLRASRWAGLDAVWVRTNVRVHRCVRSCTHALVRTRACVSRASTEHC